MRLVALAVLLATSVAVCGCTDIRYPSSIDIELPTPLVTDSNVLNICVDGECTEFTDVPIIGEASVGGMRYVSTSDEAVRYSTFHAIAPGQHHLVVTVVNQDGILFSFDGDVDFDRISRCHDTDSRVQLDADQLTVGAEG